MNTFPVNTATLNLESEYVLSGDQIERFHRDGYIKLKNVLSPEVLAHYEAEITKTVDALNQETRDMEKRDTYSKAFLQIMNLWRSNAAVEAFIKSKRLGRIATQLMGTTGVRLYHDQALYKEPSGGYTPWHVDQYYWPLSNNNTVTAWIPLQAVPMEKGPLEFSIGSQSITFGRDLEISDASEKKIDEHLKLSDLPIDSSPFDLGEVSFHYGYTFHRAGPNTTDQTRKIMTIIYMDKDMRLAEPKNKNQQNDWDTWMPGSKIGEIIDTELNPVIYQVE